jgi:hypothetical protein
MSCFNDSLLIYYCSVPTGEAPENFFHLHTLSLDFERKDSLWLQDFSHNKEISDEGRVSTYIKDGNFYVWDSNIDMIVSLNSQFEKTPEYKLYLGKYASDSFEETKNNHYIVTYVKETRKFFFIEGIFNNRYSKKILYNKETGESKNIIFNFDFHDWGFHNDLDGSIPFWLQGSVSENVLFDFINPDRLKRIMSNPYFQTIEVKNKEKHEKIKNYLSQHAKDDDNPIIFIVTMK